MVDSIGSSLPPSVQAVKAARSNAQEQRATGADAANPSDQVSISAEAQELNEINRVAAETGQILRDNPDETLVGRSGSFQAFL